MTNYILCCVASTMITEEFLEDVHSLLKLNSAQVSKIEKLSLNALDIRLSSSSRLEKISSELLKISHQHKIDMALLPDDHSRSEKRLIVFDMDSTLIQQEVIDEMATMHGIGNKVKLITERAMNGELNFDESLKERVALLKGLKQESLITIISKLKLTDGVQILIEEARKKGHKTAILSGGFNYFAENFRSKLKMDYAYANELEWDNHVLTGRLVGKIVNAEEKARLLVELAEKESIPLNHVVAIGDGANDLPMLAKAGLGIAYHAKEKVRQEASTQINYGNMRSILYFMGLSGGSYNVEASFKNQC